MAFSGGDEGAIRIWDPLKGVVVRTIPRPADLGAEYPYKVSGLAVSTEAHYVAAAGSDGFLRLWDTRDLTAPARSERTADNGDDPGTGGESVAPGTRQGDGYLPDSWFVVGNRRSRDVQLCTCPKDGDTRRRIPSNHFCLNRVGIPDSHAHTVFSSDGASGRQNCVDAVNDSARWSARAEHLHDGRSLGGGEVGEVVGQREQ